MNIILKDRDVLINQELNENNNFKYKDFTIFFSNGNYYLSLSKEYKFSNANHLKKLEKKQYHIVDSKNGYDVELFVYDVSKGEISFAFYNKEDFTITKDHNALIRQKDEYLLLYYLKLEGNQISTDSSYLFINGSNTKNHILKNGDRVKFLGFLMIYNDCFLYMNNYLVDIRLKKIAIKEEIFKYNDKLPILKNYYYPDIIDLKIDKIKPYENIENNDSAITQLGPSFTISITMMIVAYINYLDNNNIKTLLIPIFSSVSALIWPLIAYIQKNNSKKTKFQNEKLKYINYLDNYYKQINNNIRVYKNNVSFYAFNLCCVVDRLFYITKNNKMFLNITIGYTKKTKYEDLKSTNDNDINNKIDTIKNCLNQLEEIPVFIDLKNYKNITVVTSMKEYFINLYILMLISTYKYDDVILALYSNNNSILNKYYNIPHFIFNGKRFLFNSQDQIQEINNIKTKPIILLCFDKCSYHISSDNLIKIYFSNDENDLCENNDLLIRYYKTEGFYFDKAKHDFTFKTYDLDFDYYFRKIAMFFKFDIKGNNHLFNQNAVLNDIYSNYSTTQKSLKADFAYIGDELLSFDLHESKQGPHGLIGGSTGSGKSELIISLLLSLCIRYSPDYLNLIIIDYKGGGIKEALTCDNQTIEHVIASCSNLENDNIERLIIAIKKECFRRQMLFKELSRLTSENIMNIDDYLCIDFKKYGLGTISHLLIVVDEFAELKQQQPEVIKELISISRIGRSLGIHLILATQRPGGNIDEEIWSNARFKISLKVNNEKDSYDLIKNKDACMLTKPGEFYLSVDNIITKCESIYSKNNINEEYDNEVVLLDNMLNPIDKRKKINRKNITELNYYIKEINNVTNKLNIKTTKIDFVKNENKTIDELKHQYQVDNQIIIGEIDDYNNARKNILSFGQHKNIFICSTRNNEILGIINQLNSLEKQMIIIADEKYQLKYISDSLLYKDEDDIEYLFNKLQEEKHKNIYLIIKDASVLFSYSDKYIEYIINIINRDNANTILISKSSFITFRILNLFKDKYLIESNDKEDCYRMFSSLNKYKGNSFYMENEIIPFVPVIIPNTLLENSEVDNFISYIPNIVLYEENLLGYNLNNRNKIYKHTDEIVSIVSYDQSLLEKYKNIYIDMKYEFINLNNNGNIINSFIFVGYGLEKQRLFYIPNTLILEDGYGLLVRNNRKDVIRLADE